jgi:hypothetical protein
MLEYVKFFYSVYQDIGSETKQHDFLRSIVLAEARFNNDLSSVILRSGAPEIAKNNPEIYRELQTSSFELLSSLGVPPHTLLNGEREPTEQDLSNLEGSKKTLKYYESRPQVELYEFYIRKCRLLTALSNSGSMASAKISLATRVRNIEFATRFLSKKLASP